VLHALLVEQKVEDHPAFHTFIKLLLYLLDYDSPYLANSKWSNPLEWFLAI